MDIINVMHKKNSLNFINMNSLKYLLPSYIRQGKELSPPSYSLVYAGKFCKCNSPLYKRADGKIICKRCSDPQPINKMLNEKPLTETNRPQA